MLPKPPRWQDGPTRLDAYARDLDLVEGALRSRGNREWYRGDLRTAAKRYASLAGKRPVGSEAWAHFEALAAFYTVRIARFGTEPPSKKRTPRTIGDAPLSYPPISEELPLRVHLIEAGPFRRDRAAAMAAHADYLSRQAAPNGEAVLSVGVAADRAQFFEHLMEVAGPDGNFPGRRRGGFVGWVRPDGTRSYAPDLDDPQSPWRRLVEDNQAARLYHWSPRRVVDRDLITLPNVSWIPDALPWDPDPQFRAILRATEANDLAEAMRLLRVIPGRERETAFGEVLYLCYLTGSAPRGDDLRYLARKHASGSSIRSRLEGAFEDFVACLDAELVDAGPVTEDFPGLASMAWFYETSSPFHQATPPLSDWPGTRRHFREALDVYGHPIAPRGRIFAWHPGISHHNLDGVRRVLSTQLVAAEDAFRRDHGLPEIGRGWVSEAALFDLVRERCPDAVHQWRPPFLGLQSIDIYVPSVNLAIEYQGQQHYEAVDLFGGKEGLAATQTRDARKRAILARCGVRLHEWRFDVPVTGERVAELLDENLSRPEASTTDM